MTASPVRLSLPTVTLCAVASVNVEATIAALKRCIDAADFAQCLLFTDAPVAQVDPSIQVITIERLESAQAYSLFMLRELAPHIRTDHVLTVQWDGFIINPQAWCNEFLDYDYIGAPWPQFSTGGCVGNGGFSLRSRRLLEACLSPGFAAQHPEDVTICRENRALLIDRYAIRFADASLAERFSYERTRPAGASFGFHGVFNMPMAVGREAFWEIYQSLDDPRTVRTDFKSLLWSVFLGRNGLRRAMQMLGRHWRDR